MVMIYLFMKKQTHAKNIAAPKNSPMLINHIQNHTEEPPNTPYSSSFMRK
jgi:hypothetical protein